MNVQITNAGAALLAANSGPITLTSYKLGSAYGYVPALGDTGIHGTLVYQGVPSAPVASNANVVKYSAYLDYDLGSFAFGEIGFYTSTGVLFALGCGNELIYKLALTSIAAGNSIRLDMYLSMVGTNYEMWLDLAESNNEFRMAVLGSVDQIPPPQNATPNAYIISGAAGNQSAFMAYTDRSGMWGFDAYEFANQASATITARDSMSVTIALADYVPGMSPSYFGQIILEFSTGALFGICRYVKTAVISGGTVTLGFNNPLMILPTVGDKFVVFGRQALSTTIPGIPIASDTRLGAVIVGNTLTVDASGLINVKTSSYPVSSVNNKTGDVHLVAGDIPGFAAVATSGNYNDLSNRPAVYSLPIADTSTLGGVKEPTTGNIAIAGDGTIDLTYIPVKTVNGVTPDAGTGNVDVVYNLPVASMSTLGGVKSSSDITVSEDGTLGLGFAKVLTVNGGAPDGSGNVTVTIPPVIGLVAPAKLASLNLNTVQTAGLYFVLDSDAASVVNLPSASGGTLDVEPLTTTASGGDVMQRYQTATSLYFRRYTQTLNTWSTWVAVTTTASLPLATTSSVGVVKVGSGLSVDGTGNLTANVASVNGHSNTNITLNAADVGAVDANTVGMPGGVAQLDNTVVTPIPATDPFTYGRLPFNQNTLGVWWNAGLWDANANHVHQTAVAGTTPDTSTSLLANGQQIIDITYGGYITDSGAAPNYQTVSAEGNVYRVTVAGTTSLDGIAQWDVGDLVVAVAGKWTKVTVNFSNIVMGAGTF
jgi:hypothetical protein